MYQILIVDDEKEVLVALHTTLKRARQFSSEISVASSGNEALDVLGRKKFDIVLSDYMMPGMNGLELLTRIKARAPSTVLVLVTASTDINVTKEAINKVAVDHFIEKPWDNRELTSLIHQALKRKSEQTPKSQKKSNKPCKDGDDEGPDPEDIPVSLLPMLSQK